MNSIYQYGPVLGLVTDNADPDSLGRIKVAINLYGDEIETDWIPILTLYGTAECGAFMLPEVDDQVVVGFLGDSPNQPVVLGSIWSDSIKPPETGENTGSDLNGDGENNLKFIKSRSGQQIILDDKDGEEKIQILSPDGTTRFEFLMGDELLNIETDKDMSLVAGGKLAIEAEEGELTFAKGLKMEADGLAVEAGKDITITASQSLTLEGSAVNLN